MNCEFEKYRRKFSFANKYRLNKDSAKFAAAIVIPSCAEREYLPETLISIGKNDKTLLKKTCVIVVLNHPRDSNDSAKYTDNNRQTLSFLQSFSDSDAALNIFFATAPDGSYDLSLDYGVGEARKIGMDLALQILDNSANSFICSLDADTTVEPDYLNELFNFFREKVADSATIGFSHRKNESVAGCSEAIMAYEEYLANYINGLRSAGSPYSYHSLGSAMAFTIEAYIRAGGMKIRKGGEDFYFLQNLIKTGSVAEIKKILVHPSNRLSERVPFGTGQALKKILSGNKKILHNKLVFIELKKIIDSAYELCENRGNDPNIWLSRFDDDTKEFFIKQKFCEKWIKISSNTPDSKEKRLKAFHCWFDAFKTLKFIHFCENRNPARFERCYVK